MSQIFAYTAPTPAEGYAPFFQAFDRDDRVNFIVRHNDGHSVEVEMPIEAAESLAQSILVGSNRANVYSVIDGERRYQDGGKGNAKRHEGMPQMTPGEFILCMEKLLHDARLAWYAPDGGVACLDHIRKVVASGVQCMEVHGAPRREGH